MGSFLIWNSDSLRPTAEGNNKGDYLCRKPKELNSVDLVCVVETHLTDSCQNDKATSKKQISLCQSIKCLFHYIMIL